MTASAVPPPLASKQAVLKKRPTLKDLALKKSKRKELEGKPKKKRKVAFKRAERIVKEALSTSHEAIRLARAMDENASGGGRTSAGEAPVPHTLCFVYRVLNSIGATPQTNKILSMLRLTRPYTGVFLEFNEATIKLLHLVKPYVCYGTPSLKNVKDLIYKRAYCRPEGNGFSGARIPIVDNTLVEEHLEDCGIICVEDLVHVIHKCDATQPQFKRAIRFLAPFDLSAPTDGKAALLVKQEKILTGHQPHKIVDLITSMV